VGWVEENTSTAKGMSNVGRGGSKRTEPITCISVQEMF